MKKLIKVSTKTGDWGESGLITGERLPKSDSLFAGLGDIDELNSWLGLIAAKFGGEFSLYQRFLYRIQDTLFYLGAELAGSKKTKLEKQMVDELEKNSDTLQAQMAEVWHSKFLLPGGTQLGGYLDIARTVCRRSERSVVALARKRTIRPVVLQYLNRLSDYLYILRCYVNHTLQYREKKFKTKNIS